MNEPLTESATVNLPDQHTLQQRLVGLTKLVDITCELSAQHDLDRILHIVTTGVCEALACERASLFLFDESRGELHTRVVTELEIEEIRTSVDSGITGWVARRCKVANIPDPQMDARWNSSIDRKTGFHTRNILAAPVVSVHDAKLLGVLQLLNKAGDSFDSFDEQLIQAFASHAATALERARLLDEARHSQELQVEINMARNIQSSFLPDHLPAIPGYEIAAWWEPAESVSGDYYDLVPLPDGRLGLVVADVSGHGVGPSLIMASLRAMLRVVAQTMSDPHAIVSLLSETISPDLHEGRFITFLMLALDPKTHEVAYANAGHGPALHFERRTKTFHLFETTHLPMGLPNEVTWPAPAVKMLADGDLILLATDGAIELRNEQGEMFGRERLEQLVIANRRLPASELLAVLRQEINDFHPKLHPPDDVTVLLLERKL